MARPFIKWAGGKSKLLPEIKKRMPAEYNRYIEPFLGGGALFLGLMPEHALLADANKSLINCWRQIQERPERVIELLSGMEGSFNGLDDKGKAALYYKTREEYNSGKGLAGSPELAARFIFLNKTGFNGLYRENKAGNYNVPFGKKKKITLFDRGNIMEISRLLNGQDIRQGDFECICRESGCIKEGDFIFFDSPYAETFTGYSKDGFGMRDHERLKSLFDFCSEKGMYCMATNNNCQYIKDLYRSYHIEEVDVMHAINRDGAGRMATEVIITNYA